MDKGLFLPLSGFRDELDSRKPWLINELRTVFEQYGYRPLETPALERQEILLGKLGEAGQKQLYLFEDNGQRPVGLRYDLTVALARFVAGNLGSLPLPFKRFEIGPVWRAEKPQKGRYRQFYQADIDIIGAPELSSELELFSVVAMVCERLKIRPTFRLNDRRVISALFDEFAIPTEKRPDLLQLLDKKEKVTESEFEKLLGGVGLSDHQLRQVNELFMTEDEEPLKKVEQVVSTPAITSLRQMLEWGKRRNVAMRFAPSMVRGLDYYTGTIFEVTAENYDGGTIIAGGRYDSLLEQMTGQKVPAVGISFGIDRLTDLLSPDCARPPIFIVRLPETTNELNLWVRELRQEGKNVEVFLDQGVELGKQIKYADKRGYSFILIPFENEWKEGKIVKKFLETGQQQIVERQNFDEETI